MSVPCLAFSSPSLELKIRKVTPFTRCPICGEYFTIGENQILGNLEVYEAYFQDNQYNLNFFGTIGTTKNLFGEKEFTTGAGLLTPKPF
jgi:transcription elongation factor Elf1